MRHPEYRLLNLFLLVGVALGFQLNPACNGMSQEPAANPDGVQTRQQSWSRKPERVEIPDDGVTVPMKRRGGMPAIDVMVNGKGPFLFAIDTGGMGLARADETLVQHLALPRVGTIQGGDGSGKNRVEMDVVKIDMIEFGGARFTGIEAPSRNYNRSAILQKIDGMLGIDIFDEHLLVLDYENNTVKILPGELPEPDQKTIFALAAGTPVPAIRLPVGGNEYQFYLDSGNMGGVTFPARMVDQLDFESKPIQIGEARTVANTAAISQGKLTSNLRIGQHELTEPVVYVIDLPMKPNIGSEVLNHFSITFDQKNGRMKFDRQSEVPIKLARRARVGVALARQGDSITINQALPDSPAEKAGLKAGDRIIKLNGMPVEEMDRAQMSAVMTSDRPITFTINRNDEELVIQVVPEKQ